MSSRSVLLAESGSAKEPRTKNSSNNVLGEFEFAVMQAVNVLGDEAYGAEISRFLISRIGRKLAIAQVYVTLSRLEKKGLLKSEVVEPRPVKGGRSRRVFALEDIGRRALVHSTATRKAIIASSSDLEVSNGAIAKA